MSAIIPFLRDAAFDQRDITAMSAAFEDVCAALKINGDITAREVVATRIFELARCGERDVTRLRDRVLRESNGSLM
jgi:hypothetical protein